MSNANPNFLFLKEQVPNQRVTLLQGGTRSGKTYSVIYYIIWLCKTYQNANLEIDVCRDTYAALKSTAWKDMFDVLVRHNLYHGDFHNKTNHIYNLFGNKVNYYGADNPDKIHGRARDILWINEAHQFPEETIDQLMPRTRHKIICDYNPALPQEHWLDKYIEQSPPLITTYKDNPFLTKAQIVDIESKLDNAYWWKVYGTGMRAQPTGAVFNNFSIGEFKSADIMGFGQDYGFSNDPSTLIEVSIDNRDKIIYLRECFYEAGLNTGQLYDYNMKYAGKEKLIIGDSAEPRLIHELRQRGLNIIESEKGQGSVTAGLALMMEFKIILDPLSKNMQKEFNNYSWISKTNRSIPEDRYNHCIDACRYFIYKAVSNPHRGKYYIK
jgi:phage terminase large subunit